jgi:class 3 adenylate cyclase
MDTREASRERPPESARDEVVTVLFLDVVGFSSASRERTPAETFAELKTMLGRVTGLVAAHGGTVDRTLGDGLLAYFGEAPGGAGHADRAVSCAVAILRAQIDDMLARAGSPRAFILPLRIGVNSGGVYLGDLGGDSRRDVTIIGNVVNFGQRLEAACEINRIMIGETTQALAESLPPETPGLRPRPIIAKNFHEPVPAFEFDPFDGDATALQAIAAYRAFAGLERAEERVPCGGVALSAATNFGFATFVNVSPSGALLRFGTYLPRGAIIAISAVSVGLEHVPLPPMLLEVRWGAPAGDGAFVHGCRLKHLDADQRDEVWTQWRATLDQLERYRAA